MKKRLLNIRVDRIKIRDNRRPLGDTDGLLESIKSQGLLQPIIVTHKMYLAAGLHRLHVFKLLKRKYIPAFVVTASLRKARLLEIDENLMRNDLTELQKGLQMWERRLIYEEDGMPTKEIFTKYASRRSGESRRTIERYCQIGRELAPFQQEVTGTCIEDNKMELVKLASISDYKTRKEVIQLLRGGRCESVSEAQKLVELNRNVTLLGYPAVSNKADELKHMQFNFQLIQAQKVLVEEALDVARKDKSELSAPKAKNSNANCLAKICAFYVLHKTGQLANSLRPLKEQ